MNDVRDEALGALLERAAVGIESVPEDRLPEVLRRGTRRRVGRFAATGAAVAVFVSAISWSGLSIRDENETIPADVDDWRTFASLEENGWTIQVPPPWQVLELPSCPGAPERTGVMVSNVEFDFHDPQGGSPDCGERLLFAGFPRDGVALAFMPIVGDALPGLPFLDQPDTTLPLGPELLVDGGGIKGGPAETFQTIWLEEDWIGTVRRFEGPEATGTNVSALDRMLRSFQVRGAPTWVGGRTRPLGRMRVFLERPESWGVAAYRDAIAFDAPMPILRLRSPGVRGDECGSSPIIGGSRIGNQGVEIVVFDASESWGPPDLPPRPTTIRLTDAGITRKVSCRGERLRLLTFGFRTDGLPIYIDLAASETIYREQPELLLYILNSIRVEEI